MKLRLHPFQNVPHPLQIEVGVFRDTNRLRIDYHLMGAISEIVLPPLMGMPYYRKDELWKHTCFEWFLKIESLRSYWEFNSSTSGAWNFYELSDYRTDLKTSSLISEPSFSQASKKQEEEVGYFCHSLEISMDSFATLYPGWATEGRLALTAVIEWHSGAISYFSLRHPQDKADFHHDTGFLINTKEI